MTNYATLKLRFNLKLIYGLKHITCTTTVYATLMTIPRISDAEDISCSGPMR